MEEFNGKHVLIIGGLGLIGSGIARACIAQGARVTVVDNRHPEYGANDFNMADLEGKFTLILGDVREKNFVDGIVAGQDFIFNFAAQVNHNRSIEDPIFDNQLNCIGHINVLMACKHHNPQAILAYPGSRLQYGRITTTPVTESHPRVPLSIYAIHKNTAEQYYQAFYKHYGIRSVCFRITNPYGPRSQMKHSGYSIVNWFIRQTMDHQPLTIFGDGTQLRDYIYIDDLVSGMLNATQNERCYGKVYNLGSGQGLQFIEMARTVIAAVGEGEMKLVPWPKNYDNFETGDFVSDVSALTTDADWKPHHDFAAGVAKTVDYYRKFRQYYW